MRRGTYVAISGIDGAGKSTLAYGLSRTLSPYLGQIYVAEAKDEFVKQIARAACGADSPRSYFGNFAYDFAKSFGIISDHYLKIEPLLDRGVSVVAPRTIECRLAVAAAFGTPDIDKLERLLSLVPRPNCTIRLKIDPVLAVERVLKRGVDEETESGLAELSRQIDVYSQRLGWLEIDSSCSAEALLKVATIAVVDHLQTGTS